MAFTIKGVFKSVLDLFTNSIKSIDTDHYYIHEGDYYSFSEYKSMSSGATYTMGFKTPQSSHDIHIRGTVISTLGDSLRMILYEGASCSGGTDGLIKCLNHNRKISKITKMQEFKYGVTLVDAGTELLPVFLGGSTGVGQTRGGSGSPTQYEWILKPDTYYSIHFINGSAATNLVNFSINWYEELPLEI